MVVNWFFEQIIVVASEGYLRLCLALLGAQVKSKLIGFQFLLLDEVVENRVKVVGCHLRVRQSNNSIEPGILENSASLLHDLGKILLVHLNATNPDVITIDVAVELARSEHYVEGIPHWRVGWRRTAVVLLVVETTRVRTSF